jgi:hypothetical protein
MNYEINIAKKEKHPRSRVPRYQHWGRVDLGMIMEDQAVVKLNELRLALETLGSGDFELTLWKVNNYSTEVKS